MGTINEALAEKRPLVADQGGIRAGEIPGPQTLALWLDEAGLGVCTDLRSEFGRDYRIVTLVCAMHTMGAEVADRAPAVNSLVTVNSAVPNAVAVAFDRIAREVALFRQEHQPASETFSKILALVEEVR
jgi:hypothetical protein